MCKKILWVDSNEKILFILLKTFYIKQSLLRKYTALYLYKNIELAKKKITNKNLNKEFDINKY